MHAHGGGVLEAVVVEEALGLDGLARPRSEQRLGAPRRLRDECLETAEHERQPVPRDRFGEPLVAALAGGELCVEVSEGRGGIADVGLEHVVDGLNALTALHEAHGGEDQPLLKQLGALCTLGAREAPADINVVRDRTAPSNERALVEARDKHLQVWRVRAAHVGVVGDERVVGLNPAAPLDNHGLERKLHQAELRGDLF